MKELPIVALVGAPNAGKSTLLNKIIGTPLAVTSEVAGTTRDRQFADTSWNGVDFTLVDTAGLMTETDSVLNENVQKQIDVAIKEAEVLVFVADGKSPKANISKELISKIRKSKKPVILAINKTDSVRKIDENLAEFSSLGIEKKFAISAVTGNGIGDLLDAVTSKITELGLDKKTSVKLPGIAVSIIGKPNVGKSSLFNAIIKEERVVVSATPGTTRTAIDSRMTIDGDNYIFIDTAGLKRKDYKQEKPDVYSGFQTFKSMRRSDVVILVLESTEEITKQDQKLAQEIMEMNKGLILAVSKMDLYDGKDLALQDYISHHFPQLWMSPIFFTSSNTGEGIQELLSAIKPIYEAREKKIPQEELNKFLNRKLKTNSPKRLLDQKIPRVFGLHQVEVKPPTFELLVNHPAAISMQFRRTIQNAIVKELGFWGTPVVLKLKGKDKK